MIEAQGLSKVFGTFAALQDVSFSIPRGQVAAFLGPNGAGKSTTLRILTGYLTPTAGVARIAGRDVARHRIEAAARIGYLPENGPLYPEMTPLELLRFFGEARGLARDRLEARIEAVVEQCRLETVLEKSVYKLSKGYRQRLGMAQVLLHEPDILIMDEPTSGLDPNQIREVRELIRQLGATRTVLLSTHILQEVEAVADHVILIHEGRIVFDGTPGEMAAGRSLAEAFYRLTGGNGRDGPSDPEVAAPGPQGPAPSEAAVPGAEQEPESGGKGDARVKSHWQLARVVCKRELTSYFSSPTGYVFITLFVFLSALAAFWQDGFFADNLANLDQLNRVFPYLLVFLIPSITMNIWAEEKRNGTDELLLTLPATDFGIVLGKYLAAAGIYTVALLFSLTHVLVLGWLGNPDPGLMASTYLGYWLMGMALLALGMVGSLLTDNITVAFILGALLCAVPVFIDHAGTVLTGGAERLVSGFSFDHQFQDLAAGVVSLSSVVYFLAFAAAMVYLNVELLGRRHWPSGRQAPAMGAHLLVRGLALVVALAGLTLLLDRLGGRVDLTAERIHSLSPDTRSLIEGLDPGRPVFIQAYLSPEVPRSHLPLETTWSTCSGSCPPWAGTACRPGSWKPKGIRRRRAKPRSVSTSAPGRFPCPGRARELPTRSSWASPSTAAPRNSSFPSWIPGCR